MPCGSGRSVTGTCSGRPSPFNGRSLRHFLLSHFFLFVTGSTRMLSGRRGRYTSRAWRGFSIAFGFLLLILAMRTYIARFERLFDEHTIFGGVTYTDAHIILPGMLAVCAAFVLGA